MIEVAVQAQPRDSASWLALAGTVERLGFSALLAADHPGRRASPFVALAAAAAVTSRIALGSYVSNAGIREPLLLASDVATLDLLSAGRARLGLGAGHAPAEWAGVGRVRPPVAERVRRCIEVTEAVRALLAGEHVAVANEVLRVEAHLSSPRPAAAGVPITVGGANTQLLRWAGGHADVVGLSGLGRTRPDGYSHDVRWRVDDFEAQLDQIRQGARQRQRTPELEALVQVVTVTDDPESALQELSADLDTPVTDLLAVPFVLAGSQDDIVGAIRDRYRRWGIRRYVVREDAVDTFAAILPRLSEIG